MIDKEKDKNRRNDREFFEDRVTPVLARLQQERDDRSPFFVQNYENDVFGILNDYADAGRTVPDELRRIVCAEQEDVSKNLNRLLDLKWEGGVLS